MRVIVALFALCASLAAGCSTNSETTTAPSTTGPSAETFSGTLAPRESTFYSFAVSQPGTVNITLASLTLGPTAPVYSGAVGLGFGVPAGTGCSVDAPITTTAAL